MAAEINKAARQRRWRRIKWSVRAGALLFVIGYLKFVGLDGKFYYPDQKQYDQPKDYGLVHEDVWFTTRDGLKLHGWFLPAVGTPRGIVVHFHGNAANVTAHIGLIEWLPRAGYHVLMFDYRGFGQSQGRVTRAGTIADGHAAVDCALARPEAQGLPLFAYGQSLGGSVAIVVAAERPAVRAVVAESPFSAYRSVAARHARRLVPVDWLARFLATITVSDGYDPIAVVARLAPRPLLVIAAEQDEICFPDEARALYDAAGSPKDFWLVPGAEHLAIALEAQSEPTARVRALFDQAARR
jgi:fermentation-respiration switch protein FrsA (DUF1100 family)